MPPVPPTHQPSLAPSQTQIRPRDTRPSVGVPPELGKLIERDSRLVQELGWEEFVRRRRERGDLTEIKNVDHPARSLLRRYHARGVPVVTHEGRWSKEKLWQAVTRGPHPSAKLHLEFLFTEFLGMINNEHWVILPYSVPKKLKITYQPAGRSATAGPSASMDWQLHMVWGKPRHYTRRTPIIATIWMCARTSPPPNPLGGS